MHAAWDTWLDRGCFTACVSQQKSSTVVPFRDDHSSDSEELETVGGPATTVVGVTKKSASTKSTGDLFPSTAKPAAAGVGGEHPSTTKVAEASQPSAATVAAAAKAKKAAIGTVNTNDDEDVKSSKLAAKLASLDAFTIKPDDVSRGTTFGGFLRLTLIPIIIVYLLFTLYNYLTVGDITTFSSQSARLSTKFSVSASFAPWMTYATVKFPTAKLKGADDPVAALLVRASRLPRCRAHKY